ncbi:hypothetical protein [Phycicoccus jejuensis]|uniref:hypothetical protein n=1 Tax=Phycicoccus jejuensis TaxID=367299 RepID=UPI0004C461D2|nr:hypothetical protein [Phycicoccus jejuensis]
MTEPQHGPPLTRAQRFALAVTTRLPGPLVLNPERIMLNVAMIVVGITSLLALGEPGTIARVLSVPLLIMWSVTLLAGGTLVLFGMLRAHRTVERGGLMLVGLGCLTYAATLFGSPGARAQIVGGLFLAIALVQLVRLLASTAGGAIASRGRR